MRRCRTCRERKPLSDYDHHTSRSCTVCTAPTPCTVCSKPCSYRLATCSDACLHEARRRAACKAVAIREENRVRPTSHVCPGCMRHYPLSPDHFYVARRDPETGEITRLSNECKSCKRVYQRLVYEMNSERRRKVNEKARRQRQAIRARRQSDPLFDAEYREQMARYNKAHRDRQRRGPVHRPQTQDHDRYLDPQPFLDWIDSILWRYDNVEHLCVSLGVSRRTINDLRAGEREYVQLDTVDAALLAEGNTLLSDVYPALYAEAVA